MTLFEQFMAGDISVYCYSAEEAERFAQMFREDPIAKRIIMNAFNNHTCKNGVEFAYGIGVHGIGGWFLGFNPIGKPLRQYVDRYNYKNSIDVCQLLDDKNTKQSFDETAFRSMLGL